MAKAYYSTVFAESADQLWNVVRDFGNYSLWVDEVDESYVEEGRSGDSVGAIRYARIGDKHVRQRLLAHSDVARSYTYALREPYRFPFRNFEGTLRITPIVDGDKAFVEWWATFDCADGDYVRWTSFLNESFAKWLGSLRGYVAQARDPVTAC